MESGRHRLINAALSLLAESPGRVPSTRELYEAAGVAAPTLYHHFGTKEHLLEAVVDEAFSAYLKLKNAAPDTGDLVVDFESGWDKHIDFGLQNPVLYGLMYGSREGRRCEAALKAESELRRRLQLFADEGVLAMGVDEALAVTTAMAIGCVMQLVHDGGSATGPFARTMRAALIAELIRLPTQHDDDLGRSARLLLTRLGPATDLFSPAEDALLRQWLRTLAKHFAQTPKTS